MPSGRRQGPALFVSCRLRNGSRCRSRSERSPARGVECQMFVKTIPLPSPGVPCRRKSNLKQNEPSFHWFRRSCCSQLDSCRRAQGLKRGADQEVPSRRAGRSAALTPASRALAARVGFTHGLAPGTGSCAWGRGTRERATDQCAPGALGRPFPGSGHSDALAGASVAQWGPLGGSRVGFSGLPRLAAQCDLWLPKAPVGLSRGILEPVSCLDRTLPTHTASVGTLATGVGELCSMDRLAQLRPHVLFQDDSQRASRALTVEGGEGLPESRAQGWGGRVGRPSSPAGDQPLGGGEGPLDSLTWQGLRPSLRTGGGVLPGHWPPPGQPGSTPHLGSRPHTEAGTQWALNTR